MKTMLCLSLMVCLFADLQAQTCNITINGSPCTGSTLTAVFATGTLARLTWKNNNNVVFVSDTISSPDSVDIVAGGHGEGTGNDQFGFPPGGMALDKNGNLYIADLRNNRVVKWAPDATSGVVVAGGNGAGQAANQLWHPQDVFVDAAGNVYVADLGNARIQKWSPGVSTGTTVAGGNGNGSGANQLSAPSGVYVDGNGTIYIADKYNYRIQKWLAGATAGSTIAGGVGTNEFYLPVDVYGDAAGNIYVADADADQSEHHRIKKFSPNNPSGVVIAGGNGTGSGADQFNYITSLRVLADGTLYVADAGNRRVVKFTPGTQNGITVAGGHGFGTHIDQLNYATGLDVNEKGDVYVMDGGTYSVKKFYYIAGVVTTSYTPNFTGDYTVEAIFKDGCTVVSDPIRVYSKPVQQHIYPMRRGGRGNLCSGGTDTFYVSRWDDQTNYTWTTPAGTQVINNKNNSVIIQVDPNFNSGFLIAKGTNFCGTGMLDTIGLQGKPVRPFKIMGPKKVRAFQQGVIYSVQDDGFIYHWRVSNNMTIVSGQNTPTLTVNFGDRPAEIAVTATNSCGTSGWRTKMVYPYANQVEKTTPLPNSETRNSTIANFSLQPNPARQQTRLTVKCETAGTYTIFLFDLAGRQLQRSVQKFLAGTNILTIEVSRYPAGTYLVKVQTDKNEQTFTLQKE